MVVRLNAIVMEVVSNLEARLSDDAARVFVTLGRLLPRGRFPCDHATVAVAVLDRARVLRV